MTIAVCKACGVQKIGAFTECLECGYQPPDNDDLSMLLTEWSSDQETMDTVEKYIQDLKQKTKMSGSWSSKSIAPISNKLDPE
jgi:uncharacterized protein (DUF342 family)